MAHRIEVVSGIFSITDTITSVVELSSPASNVFFTELSGRIFFFLRAENERTLGYLWSDFVDADDNPFASLQDVIDYLDTSLGDAALPGVSSKVDDYRADFEVTDEYIYSGFNFNLVPTILRTKDSVVEVAQGVTNLTTDWTNRLSLTYL